MKRGRGVFRLRTAALALAGGMAVLLAGDGALRMAPPPGVGIDPLEVLDQQVKHNVLIVLDTSSSMKWTFDEASFSVGGDDRASRLYQAKQAIIAAVTANQARANIGLATYSVVDGDKTINRTQDFEGDTRADGPFVYVSADAGADQFFVPQTCAATGTSTDGFFCDVSDVFGDYDDPVSAEIFRSLSNVGGTNQTSAYNDPYPAGCTPGIGQLDPLASGGASAMRCRYYTQSRLLRDGVLYVWDRTLGPAGLVSETPITCPAPPADLLSHAGTSSCFQLQDGVGGAISTFHYTSSIFQDQVGPACPTGPGAAILAETDNGSCTGNAPAVLSKMDLELPLADIPAPPGGASFDYGDGHLDGDQTTVRGVRADQGGSPLKATLDAIRIGTPVFPNAADPGQRNFVILVTDGDDSCANPDPDLAAVAAADAAEALYEGQGGFRHTATTIVVGLGNSVTPARLDVIAQGGSGAFIDGSVAPPRPPGDAVVGCRSGAPCYDALIAQDPRQLTAMIKVALERAGAIGIFSATPSVFDAVPEYVDTVDPSPAPSPFNVLDPDSRYQASAFRSYRASFDGTTFDGFVKAFDQAGPIPGWEAGQKLLDRVTPDLFTTDRTFAQLLSAAAPTPPGIAVDTHIDRRIFTTRQNGRELARMIPGLAADNLAGTGLDCGSGPCRVNLWPPDTTTSPAVNPAGTAAGLLDERLFRKPDGTQMTTAELQAAPFRACMGAPLSSACSSSLSLGARKEAREMILAYTAGAAARRDANGNPLRNAAGEILYRARPWLLADSTVGAPALVTPPLNRVPEVFGPEYLAYRDGFRNNTDRNPAGNSDAHLAEGFGLRNPDRDANAPPTGSDPRSSLKPVMSVLYVPANDMLHAFRAGPCPTGITSCGAETGGEELWAFVPHDLLPKLKERMSPQTRTSHTYMISTSLRFADVFVPGTFRLDPPTVATRTDFVGQWRRVLLFGRGIGGKYYSALDITGVGALTRHSLTTRLPGVLWNRGNPDTDDGRATGRAIRAADTAAYLDMGQTWSTPAVGRFRNLPGYVAVVGSGYGTADREGTRFYVLNVLTGDVVDNDSSLNVGDSPSQPLFQNAIVANPVVYSPELLVAGIGLPHPSSPFNEAAYVGDVHGRLWKYDPFLPAGAHMQLFRNLGVEQPIGVAAALLNLGNPHVFVETGADARVSPPGSGFKIYGFRDDKTLPYPSGVVTPPLAQPEFSIDFLVASATKGAYRGTLQPVSAFRGSSTAGTGVVFFTGTRTNPPIGPCASTTFDTIIFGAVATTGGAAYATAEFEGVKAVGVPRPPVVTSPGVPPVDQGTPQPGQEPGVAPVPPNKVGGASLVRTTLFRPGSAVCR